MLVSACREPPGWQCLDLWEKGREPRTLGDPRQAVALVSAASFNRTDLHFAEEHLERHRVTTQW